MELDNLKDLWQGWGEAEVHPRNGEQILSMLKKRSQSPIAKMKRNLFKELIAVLVIYSLTIWYYLVAWEGRYWAIALLLFVVGVTFLFYYYYKNKLLKEMQCTVCEVRSNLKRQLKTLEKFIRFYFISGFILTPLAYYMSGIIIIFQDTVKTRQAFFSAISESRVFLIFIILGIILIYASYLLNKWYVHKLYGQHVEKLKELLREMEELD